MSAAVETIPFSFAHFRASFMVTPSINGRRKQEPIDARIDFGEKALLEPSDVINARASAASAVRTTAPRFEGLLTLLRNITVEERTDISRPANLNLGRCASTTTPWEFSVSAIDANKFDATFVTARRLPSISSLNSQYFSVSEKSADTRTCTISIFDRNASRTRRDPSIKMISVSLPSRTPRANLSFALSRLVIISCSFIKRKCSGRRQSGIEL